MMGNAAILDDNLALTATLTGGNWALPLDNLLDPTVKETVARCVSIRSEVGLSGGGRSNPFRQPNGWSAAARG